MAKIKEIQNIKKKKNGSDYIFPGRLCYIANKYYIFHCMRLVF